MIFENTNSTVQHVAPLAEIFGFFLEEHVDDLIFVQSELGDNFIKFLLMDKISKEFVVCCIIACTLTEHN
jgi:hypothetical protein